MKQINLTEEQRTIIMDSTIGLAFTNFNSVDAGRSEVSFNLDYAFIDRSNKALVDTLKEIVTQLGYDEIVALRFNRFDKNQYVDKHMDTAFPGYDTVVVQLKGHSRFTYRYSGAEWESPYDVLALPEGTYHKVNTAKSTDEDRLTLVMWVRKTPNHRFNEITLPWSLGVWEELLSEAVDVAKATSRVAVFEFQGLKIKVDTNTSKKIAVEKVRSFFSDDRNTIVDFTGNGVIRCKQ